MSVGKSAAPHSGLICALLYVVQFDADPRDGIDRVLNTVIDAQCLDATPMDYLRAVHEALESKEALADLIPQHHPEHVIRRYLADLGAAIERRWGGNTDAT